MADLRPSLTEVAIRGSALTTVQTIVNKAAALAASVVLAKLLDPADYGVAFTATTLGAFLFVLAPWVLNDLLVSRPKHFEEEAGTALAVGMTTGIVLGAAMVAGIPWLRSLEPDSAMFPLLLAVAAARPIADAWMAVPWARLRLQLRYGRIAMIDGSMQLAATAVAVALAVAGAGPLALVLPPVAVLFAQGAGYWWSVRGTVPLRAERRLAKPVIRRFTVAAASQYLNNAVKVLEMLMLTWFGGPTAVGLFAFSFQLSSQANVVVANQVSGVIQPVLSHINDEPDRQCRAFLRALRLIGCVGVPISLIQGAVGVPCFRLLFGTKWDGAIPVFAALSVMQAFIFLATPIMTLLKAQGRFRAILAWQSLHLVTGALAVWALARPGLHVVERLPGYLGMPATEGSGLPLAAAIGGTFVWAVGCPVALRVAVSGSRISWRETISALALPWPAALLMSSAIAAIPVVAAPAIGETAANVVAVVASLPAAGLSIILAAAPERQCREDLHGMLRRGLERVRRPLRR